MLTVLEAKGLEFDDVFLIDFFKESPATFDEWRAINSYLMLKTGGANTELLDGPLRPVKDFQQNVSAYNSICEELKQLYTAFTRARVSLFIYDSDPEKRGPIYNALLSQKLAKRLSMQSVTAELQGDGLDLDGYEAAHVARVRARSSTPQEWKKAGERFFERGLFDAAAMAFEKSGNKPMEHRARGRQISDEMTRSSEAGEEISNERIQTAGYYLLHSREKEEIEVAMHCFYKVDALDAAVGIAEKLGGMQARGLAEKMLKRIPKRHDLAARLYLSCFEVVEASKCWERAGDLVMAMSTLESVSSPGGIFQPSWTSTGLDHAPEVHRLAELLADQHRNAEDWVAMNVVLPKLGPLEAQVRFLEKHHRHADCVELLKRHGLLTRAADKVIGVAVDESSLSSETFLTAAETLANAQSSEDRLMRARCLMKHHEDQIHHEGSPTGLLEAIKLLAENDANIFRLHN